MAADPLAELLNQFEKAVKSKTVAWVPVWMGVLEGEWTRVMKAHFDDYGIKMIKAPPTTPTRMRILMLTAISHCQRKRDRSAF